MSLLNLLPLLANKWVIGALGTLIGSAYMFFKGYRSAKAADEAAQALAERAQQARLRAAEAKNQFLEKQGERQNEQVDSANSIDQLIGMWNSQQPGQDKSNPSNKNS